MDLHLETLRLENFRCYSAAKLALHEQLTVLVADNGHGKSAALDALAICIAQLLGPTGTRAPKSVGARPQITDSDASTSFALPPYQASAFPVILECSARIDGEPTAWSGTAPAPDTAPAWTIPSLAASVTSQETLRRGAEVTLPVFAYYGTNRTLASVVQTKPPTLGRLDRAYGYKNALAKHGGVDELGPWLAQGEWDRSGRGTSTWESALDAVYSAATQILGSHGVSRVSYSMEDRDLLLDFGRMVDDPDTRTAVPIDPGAAVIPMSLVADGYRSVLGMVADLAFRCGVLNHHLGGEAPQHTSGIVLIDEIDMHLHPSWQTHVLRDLAAAFPRIQFVVTTHSPFILSSIEGDCVRQISSDDGRSSFVAPMRHTLGTRIEVLTRSLLGAPIRASSPLTATLERLAESLSRRDLDAARLLAEEVETIDPDLEDPDAFALVSELRWRVDRQPGSGASG